MIIIKPKTRNDTNYYAQSIFKFHTFVINYMGKISLKITLFRSSAFITDLLMYLLQVVKQVFVIYFLQYTVRSTLLVESKHLVFLHVLD